MRSTKKQIKRIKQTKQIISENLKSAKPKYFVDLLFRLSKKQIKGQFSQLTVVLDSVVCISLGNHHFSLGDVPVL